VVFVAHAVVAQPGLSDDEIRRRIVQDSIASYTGACPCPESVNRAGRRCGGNSAYSRPGGAKPFCYVEDVTKEMVDRYRQHLSIK
jgi:hypothetical protein